MPAPSRTASIRGRFEDDATASRKLDRQALDRLHPTREQRQLVAVALQHQLDDLAR